MTAIVPGVVFKPLPAGGLVYSSCEKLAFVGCSKKIGDESRKGRIFLTFFFYFIGVTSIKSRIVIEKVRVVRRRDEAYYSVDTRYP